MLAWFAVSLRSRVPRCCAGRRGRICAIGSNPEAARFAGIRAGRRVILAFTICGALAGLGGFLWASRFPNVDAVAADGFELDVITAVVIGGVNVFGGSGSILGVVLGAVLVATIQDGFTLLRLSEFWKMFFNGAAIVAAITIDALVTRRLQDALRRGRRSRYSPRPACRAGAASGRALREAPLAPRLVVRSETLLVVAIVGVSIWSTTLSPFFLTRANLLDLITPYVFIGLMALGLDVRCDRRRDRHLGRLDPRRLGRVVRAAPRPRPERLARRVAGLVVAAGLGLVNGVLVGLVNLPSLAVTLGTLAAFQGLAFVVLSGEGVAEFPQGVT